MTKRESYAIGTSTTLESNKSHRKLKAAIINHYRYLERVQNGWLSTGGEPSCGQAPCTADPV